MLDTVLNKAGQSAGDAVGAGVEDVAGGYIGLMLSLGFCIDGLKSGIFYWVFRLVKLGIELLMS